MQMSGGFNAQQFEPNQGFGIHPPMQKGPFTITNTAIKENSNKDGGYLQVEFTSPQGTILNIYNIWSKSPKAVEIAHGQLSALCRAIGRYQIEWGNEAAALRGGTGLMDVGYQKGEEPDPAFPDRKGYTELKRVYDMAGNDPAKAAPAQTQPQPQVAPQPQPMTQQPGGGWGQQAQQPNPVQQPSQGWQQPVQNVAPQQLAQPQGQAWQPGGQQPSANPPWGNRT